MNYAVTDDVKAVGEWVWCSPSISRDKFLMLCAEYGTGKTAACIAAGVPRECVFDWATLVDKWRDDPIQWHKVPSLTRWGEYDAQRNVMPIKNRGGKIIVIDDLRPLKVGKWGVDPADAFGSLVCAVYAQKTARLIVTSNMDGKEIAKEYPGRAVSRLKSNAKWLGPWTGNFRHVVRGTDRDLGPHLEVPEIDWPEPKKAV